LLEPPSEADEEEGILISPKSDNSFFTTPSLLLLKTFTKFHVTADGLAEVEFQPLVEVGFQL